MVRNISVFYGIFHGISKSGNIYLNFLDGQHGSSSVLRDTIIFSPAAFSQIVYRLTARIYFNKMVRINSLRHVQSSPKLIQNRLKRGTVDCEVTKADIRAICDEAGCDTNQVIGLLLELNILIVKLQDFSAVSVKGRRLYIKKKNS